MKLWQCPFNIKPPFVSSPESSAATPDQSSDSATSPSCGPVLRFILALQRVSRSSRVAGIVIFQDHTVKGRFWIEEYDGIFERIIEALIFDLHYLQKEPQDNMDTPRHSSNILSSLHLSSMSPRNACLLFLNY